MSPKIREFHHAYLAESQFNRCLIEHLNTLYLALAAQIIAVDGKALRGSHELK